MNGTWRCRCGALAPDGVACLECGEPDVASDDAFRERLERNVAEQKPVLDLMQANDDDEWPARPWWANTSEDGINWYEHGRFSFWLSWREWMLGFGLPDTVDERRWLSVRLGPLTLAWETTRA